MQKNGINELEWSACRWVQHRPQISYNLKLN